MYEFNFSKFLTFKSTQLFYLNMYVYSLDFSVETFTSTEVDLSSFLGKDFIVKV